MKVTLVLACTCAILSTQSARCGVIRAPLDFIGLDDLTPSERQALRYLDAQFHRPKRSGDIISHLKQGVKNKVVQIAKGSAASVSKLSSSSSHSHHHYDIPETYDHKSFDFWALKKSILNSLLQAVKAIKGGAIALKGYLIKGSGKLVTAKGKFLSAKGEAIKDLGKNIAAEALLSPHPSQYLHHEAVEYAHPHYSHSSSGIEYSAPSAPGPDYTHPSGHDHYHHQHHDTHISSPGHTDKLPLSGILILKKIPHNGREIGHSHAHHEAEESRVPEAKPAHSGPGWGEIITKFLKASSSLKPGEPEPFGDEHHHQETHEHAHQEHADYPDHYPPFSNIPIGHGHSSDHHDHESSPTAPETHHSLDHHFHDDTSDDYISGKGSHSSEGHDYDSQPKLKPPSTSYGTPFEEPPSYLDYDGFPLPTKDHPKVVKPSKSQPESPASTADSKLQNEHKSHPLTTASTGFSSPTSTSGVPHDYSEALFGKPIDLLATLNLQTPETSQNSQQSYESLASQFNLPLQKPTDYSSFSTNFNYQLDARGKDNMRFLKNFQNLYQTPTASALTLPTASALNSPLSSPNTFNLGLAGDSFALPTKSVVPFKPLPPRNAANGNNRPNGFNVVRSVTYQLGPNGPKRL